VAAQLEGAGTQVERQRGKLGELRVTIDGQDAYRGNRLLYATPGAVLKGVRAWLARQPDAR
jgi:hypothetical protein